MALLEPPVDASDAKQPQVNVMKKPSNRTILLTICTFLAVWFSTSCGTVRGFGRDVETVGGSIEESAR